MLSYEEIMNYCSNYRVENGNVFDKNTNQQIIDEDIILKVKSSILLFKESKKSYQSDMQQFGKVSKSQEDYIKKTMEKFSVHNEQSSFGINKLVNAKLNSNGHYEEFMSGNDLQNSKFSILVAPKNEYGLAFLKLKFREKGLDIEDLKISQDLSELQHNGVSKVIIDFKVKKYEKTVQNNQENLIQSNIQHPRAQELNELEKEKEIAKQNNDDVAYNYAKSSIEKIIRESRLKVSPEQWDSMGIQDKIAFVKIKMNEARILNDQDEFNYWNSNLNSLNEKVQSSESKTEDIFDEIVEVNQPTYNSAPTSGSNSNDYQEMIQELETKKDYNYYFDEMLKATQQYNPNIQMTDEQKKQLIGEIFYNEGYLIESLSNDEELRQIMTRSVNELSNNEMQIKLQNIILTEIQEKHKQFHPEKQEVEQNQNVKKTTENKNNEGLDLSVLIKQLRNELNQVQNAYRSMLSDGYIDDEELTTLLGMIDKVINNGYSLKSLATNQSDLRVISVIINSLEEEQKKMNKMQNGIEEIGRSMR